MEFKSAITLMGKLIALLIAIGALVVTSAATINLGGFYTLAGILNLGFGAFAIGKNVIKQIKESKL